MRIESYLSILSIVALLGYISINEANKGGTSIVDADSEITQMTPLTPSMASSIELPKEMHFSGEEVPLQRSDVYERLDREIHINTYWHNNTIFILKRAHRWFPQIEEILREQGVPEDFKYLAAIESNLVNDVSPKNAVGFWQIRKATGRELGLEISKEVDERYDPIKSTYAACKYLKKAYEKFGSWTLVAAGYNRGMSGLQRALDRQKVESYYDLLLNEETSRYVFRILAVKEILTNPANYNFEIKDSHLYKPLSYRKVEVEESITDLVDFAKENDITYKQLKQYNPWLRSERLTVRGSRTYQIAIPS